MTDIAEPPTDSGKLSEIEAIAEAEGISLSAKPESFGRQAWKRFRSHKLAIVGSITLTLLVATFFIGPYISPYEFDEINVLDRSQGPSADHWFGTDDIGRDLFVRSMKGGQFSMRISVLTGLMAAALGGILGALAGYLSGIVDTAISFLINTLLTVNSLPRRSAHSGNQVQDHPDIDGGASLTPHLVPRRACNPGTDSAIQRARVRIGGEGRRRWNRPHLV